MSYARQRKHILLVSITVISVVSLLITSVTIAVLYRAALQGQQERLTDAANTLARFIDAIARFDATYSRDSYPAGAREATLSQVVEAHKTYKGFGRTGEFLVAELEGDTIVFLLAPRRPQSDRPLKVPLDSELAAPMHRALRGESGTMVGLDYQDVEVLAAYEPIPTLGLGIVAKMDLAEIRAPFVQAAWIAGGAAILFVLGGSAVFRRTTTPLIERLEQDERRYRTLFDLSPHGVLVIDPAGATLSAFNQAAHEQLGYSRAEFARLRMPELDGESRRNGCAKLTEAARTGGGELDVCLRTKQGEIRETRVWTQALPYAGKDLIYVVFQDVTEQRRTQRALQDQQLRLESQVRERTAELRAINEQLQQEIGERSQAEADLKMAGIVYDNSAEGICVTDAEGTILTVNPAFSEITGYPLAEAIGRNPRILKSDRQDRAFYRGLWSALLHTGRWQGELWNRRKNGEAYLQHTTITQVRDERGQPKNYVAIFTDITELRRSEEHIRHQAYHDALTGLPNRLLFHDRLQQAMAHAQRTRHQLAVMFLDLDRFKLINDTLGHDIGDLLLQAVTRRLQDCLREEDTVSRFGGDEFVVLLNEVLDTETVEHVARKIGGAFLKPFAVAGHELSITTSIGIGLFPNDGSDVATLIKRADTAMYWAKDCGRNNYQFYTPEMDQRTVHHIALESSLRRALLRRELYLLYQPRIALHSGRVVGAEALVRWRHPERGSVPPEDFIPLAEDTGLIVPLGDWVLEDACRQIRQWQQQGFDLRVSVNISAHQFNRPDLLSKVDAILEQTQADGRNLELELTETLVMQHASSNIATLQELKRRGIGIAIDDFGTGYSSLSYLKRFPIDTLKIDRSFIHALTTDADNAAITQTIINLGRTLRLDVVAEGVETEQELAFLQANGCDTIQGFYFARPLPAEELTERLAHGGPWQPQGAATL